MERLCIVLVSTSLCFLGVCVYVCVLWVCVCLFAHRTGF